MLLAITHYHFNWYYSPAYMTAISLSPGAHPSLNSSQTGIFRSPTAHRFVRDLKFRVDGLIGNRLELLILCATSAKSHQSKERTRQNTAARTQPPEPSRRNTRRENKKTYCSQLLITQPQLRLIFGIWPPSIQYLIAVFDPALRSSLAEVDLLSFVASAIGVKKNPVFLISTCSWPPVNELISSPMKAYVQLQLRLGLLIWAATSLRHPRVRPTIQDALPIEIALAQCRPTLCVIVIHVDGVHWR